MSLIGNFIKSLNSLPDDERYKVTEDLFNQLSEEDREEIKKGLLSYTKDQLWIPNPGPQTEAYFCEADELFYGGQAGGGKSALSVGLSVTAHHRSLILRRINKDAKKLAEAELLNNIFKGDRNGWNGTDLTWKDGEKYIEFGGCELETDKQRYKGDPHDLIVFDEVTDFLEAQYIFIATWNRTTKKDQRCRVLATGNPPTSAEGLWVIKRWAAWLDPKHPNPAQPGELRWYISDDEGNEVEVKDKGPHIIGEHEVYAKSRTFIPAKLSDNPYLSADGEYKRILDSLPIELRNAYRDGKFDTSLKDNPWQVIPTQWIIEAQKRWTPKPPPGVPMCAIGVDVAQGGIDNNIIAPRYDGWYAPLTVIPGKDTPLGTDLSGDIIVCRRDKAKVIIDCGGGYGGSAYKHLKENDIDVVAYKGAEGSSRRTIDNLLPFNNKRSESIWRFREALDPSQAGGSPIALPPDNELLSDLTSATYDVKSGSIKVESKLDIKKRIGRSPDKGDAVVMAWADGNKSLNIQNGWQAHTGFKPQVVVSYPNIRRR